MNTDIQSPRERKKKEIQRKLFWGTLCIVGIVVLFGAFILLCCGSGSKKSEEERTVRSALRLKHGEAPLKILDISKPDSVFYKPYVSGRGSDGTVGKVSKLQHEHHAGITDGAVG